MSDRRGFSLIELMIVVCIIGIIASFAVPKFDQVRAKARAGDVVMTMRTVRIAATLYYDSASAWPASGPVGSPPPGLSGYLPRAGLFTGAGWTLRWQTVAIAGGGTQGWLQADTGDPLLCPSISKILGGPSATLSVACAASGGTVTQNIER